MAESYSQIKSVAVYGSIMKPGFTKAADELFQTLRKHNITIYLAPKVSAFIASQDSRVVENCKILSDKDLLNVDMVLSLGGDGTFLKTAQAVGAIELPILGINLGNLGFLVDISGSEITAGIEDILKNGYSTECRSQLMIQPIGQITDPGQCVALNELAVLKSETSSMIKVSAYVNGEFLCTYKSDGLVISTPTGSTAYAMSVGASILDPESHDILLAPVAPHSLNQRPIVLPDDRQIELEIEGRNETFLVSLDGRSYHCKTGSKIKISKAPFSVYVAKRKGHTYFQTLREKLNWGLN